MRPLFPQCTRRSCSTIGFPGAERHAAIEFKYASTKQEVKGAVSGILEDVGGYGGSNDWNRFFAVIFQTEAFFAEGPVESSIVRVGGTSWTPIIVTGRGR